MCSVNLSNFILFGKVSNNTGFGQLIICYVSEFKFHITVLWMRNKGSIHLLVLFLNLPLRRCSMAWAWWGNNLPRLAKLCICSLNLTGSSAFHPIHPCPQREWFLPQYWESSFCLAKRPHCHCLQFALDVRIQMWGWCGEK